MISLRKQIDEADHFAPRFEALRQAHLALTDGIPKAALPADPGLAEECKQHLDEAALAVTFDAPAKVIEQAGKTAVGQLDLICRANTRAIEERDAALKEVAGSFADVINGFKGHGEKHNAAFEKIAGDFEEIAHLDDVNQMRKRLREDVTKLRASVDAMKRESEESVKHFESQITSFQERLEKARRESGLDRLTGLGGRREAEHNLRQIGKRTTPVSVLVFDIEGFAEINRQNGTPFGDKILQALAHTLSEAFPDKDSLFRWGPDEFVVVDEGRLSARLEAGRVLCRRFAANSIYSSNSGSKRITANVAVGGVEYNRGDGTDDLYRRARENMEKNRGG